ncbi:hypothetical protein ILYODFUR_016906 [Ilyodon furcidens]|uniref:Uncharacterized protein n=1 Tax=Ilyodon furcidens TaxID=33524 RepID=A0ABV0SYT5_9TELE
MGSFHGKRKFSCSPERNPVIFGQHVTGLSCSPETSFHHLAAFLLSLSLSMNLLHSCVVPCSHARRRTPAAAHTRTGSLRKRQQVSSWSGLQRDIAVPVFLSAKLPRMDSRMDT